jgi:hypothetical protein
MRCQFLSRRDELVRNLGIVYAQTIPTDIEAGQAWYPAVRKIVTEWSIHYGIPQATVACVVAAVSPQCPWERNLVIADDILADRAISIGALHANVVKARHILQDQATSTLGYFPYGPKVYNFALALQGSDEIVVVDTHGAQAALNNPKATVILKWTPYQVFSEAYRRAASFVHRPNAEFQAIVWHIWKRLYPRTVKPVLRRQWEPIGEY